MTGKPQLLSQMHEEIKLKHYSIHSARVYCDYLLMPE